MEEPVTWIKEVKKINDSEFDLIFKGTPGEKWHFYSQYTEGTMPMDFGFDSNEGFKVIGNLKESPKPKEEYDDLLGGLTKYWDKTATLTQRIKMTTTEKTVVKGYIDYQSCIDGACTNDTYEFSFEIQAPAVEKVETQSSENTTEAQSNENTKEENTAVVESENKKDEGEVALDDEEDADSQIYEKDLWAPVTDQVASFENNMSSENKSFLIIFLLGFVGGFIALVTPCVWPMIPMTVSFFIKKSEKTSGKRDALLYGLSIIVIFVSLGLGITAVFGADAMNALATSAGFNVAFFIILVFFAAAFLGAFELTLPSSWVNKMDAKADKTSGLISIFFMAFTLVLVSFSCTGPIIGTLLVESITKGMWGPFWGMLGFSIALALPFTLFAFFPSMMKKVPQSGGWLNSVKVVLGFLELALAFKFLSVADMAYHWGILDREVFLSIWIVIFALLGMYLLGKLRFNHDSVVEKISVFRLSLAIVSLSFALYMVPGLWGAPLKAISAFSPPQNTQDFNLYEGSVHGNFYDYEEGMKYAKRVGKPAIVDFTGYGCVNCRNVEAAVWTDPRVKQMLEEDYVLISLYVDDKAKLPEDQRYVSKFSGNTIRTVGNKWSDLQISKFGSSSQPYYFLLDHDGTLLSEPRQYDLSIEGYIEFLRKGLNEYKKRH
jgi:thiol:disulfide interchange protein DsbD